MGTQRSDGRGAEQTEDEAAVFERVWHGKDARAETALYQVQQSAAGTEMVAKIDGTVS